mgnify:CR=1 FL=1
MSDDYMVTTVRDEDYERVTNLGGIRTTICKNRFEVVCQDRAETNDQQIVQELRAWLSKRRQDEVRDAGGVPAQVS